MLAERVFRGRPRRSSPVRAALALLLGLAGVLVGIPAAVALEPGAPVRVAVAVPIVVPASTTGLVNADALTQYTSPVGLLTRQLDSVIDRPVTIAIDPMIIVSIRLLGSSAPPSATEWLARLDGASNEIIALPYADSDLTLATQAGPQGVIGPLGFDFAIDAALFEQTPETTATPSPTPTAAPDEPVLPTSESLVEWPYTVNDIAWPRANSVIASDLVAFENAGYDTTILASGNVSREGTATSSVTIGDQRILVSDDAVSSALVAAAKALTPDDWQAAMGQVYEAIAAAGRVQAGSEGTLFVAFDRTVPITSARIAETLAALEANVPLIGISAALNLPPSGASLVDEPQAAEAVAEMSRLLLAEQGEQRFATIAADPNALIAQRRLALLAVTANSWPANPTGWAKATDGFVATSVDIRNSVQLVKSSSLNFFADSASIPIAVSNSLNQAVTVYVTVHPETALLAVENSRVELTIEPNSQGKAEVPVQAISNGTVRLTVSLSAASGEPIGASSSTKVNVQAGWETPIVLAIAIIVVAVFGIGIVRNILRRRKPADTPETATESTPADD